MRDVRGLGVAALIVVTLAGCSQGNGDSDSGQPSTPSTSVTPIDFSCPASSDAGWPDTDHPKARDELLPATPVAGVECRYRGPSFAAQSDGPTVRLSRDEIGGLVSSFAKAPELKLQRCPNSADPITFSKYHFQYSDGTVVVIEKGRYTCPPSISNGQRQRGYPTS
ncbi:hypothetical protein [Williamsia sp. CHRR-6]|uniref:hypothetical protein n=1 Tax=Williamsia sp. CHRR-6 TaxID=2835871 RepID=UPI001BDB239E|nr:hypothetical protein [Williamsia sp. CHRR-6]MBT0567777.1 hypothetical protein [Williamsia sp. CHRR-6]